MTIKNIIYYSFGPFESFAYRLIFEAGCVFAWISLKSILLILGGAFFGFTYLGAQINIKKNKVRNGDVLFGIFSTGKWININPEMLVGIIKWTKVSRIFSWSNRNASIPESDFLIVLFNSEGKKLLTLNKKTSLEQANDELFRLGDLLNLRHVTQ